MCVVSSLYVGGTFFLSTENEYSRAQQQSWTSVIPTDPRGSYPRSILIHCICHQWICQSQDQVTSSSSLPQPALSSSASCSCWQCHTCENLVKNPLQFNGKFYDNRRLLLFMSSSSWIESCVHFSQYKSSFHVCMGYAVNFPNGSISQLTLQGCLFWSRSSTNFLKMLQQSH